MKINKRILWTLAVGGLAMTPSCADKAPPPPPGVAVVGVVPDYCFWDGYEYVGWYGDGYYYWGPGRVWIVCDPIRVQRVNVYVQSHPNWRTKARTLIPAQSKVEAQPPVENNVHLPSAQPARDRHGSGHDN